MHPHPTTRTDSSSSSSSTPARDHCAASRGHLVEHHLPLVRSLAARMIRSARPYLEMDDLISIGAEALLRASERFDPDRKVSFGSFAYLRVRGAMVEGIGRVGPHTRGCVRRRANRPEPTPRPMPCSYEDGRHASASRSELTESLHAAIETRRLAGRIGAALDALAPNERALIERHYLRGESLLEVARDLHISKSWASRLHARALESIRNSLEPAPQVQ